jgi:hypothetical protein
VSHADDIMTSLDEKAAQKATSDGQINTEVCPPRLVRWLGGHMNIIYVLPWNVCVYIYICVQLYPELPPHNAFTDTVSEIYPLGDVIPFDFLGQIDPKPLIQAAKDPAQFSATAKKYAPPRTSPAASSSFVFFLSGFVLLSFFLPQNPLHRGQVRQLHRRARQGPQGPPPRRTGAPGLITPHSRLPLAVPRLTRHTPHAWHDTMRNAVQGRLLSLIGALLKLRSFIKDKRGAFMLGDAKDAVHGVLPEEVVRHFLPLFADGEGRRFRASTLGMTRMTTYIVILLLHASEFRLDVATLSTALELESKKCQQYLISIGCRSGFSKKAGAGASKADEEDAEAAAAAGRGLRVFTLRAPLRLPDKTRIRGKAK